MTAFLHFFINKNARAVLKNLPYGIFEYLVRFSSALAGLNQTWRRPSLEPLSISCTQGPGSELPPEAPSAAPIGPNRGASTSAFQNTAASWANRRVQHFFEEGQDEPVSLSL